MADQLPDFQKRDRRGALRVPRKLLAHGDNTTQVFVIMRALNGNRGAEHFARWMKTPGGPRLACQRVELAERFSYPDFVAGFQPGTVGTAYGDRLAKTGYSALGLVEISSLDNAPLVLHPHAWSGRRIRDVWHALTGYEADETVGEAALVAFSYAQTGGPGWAFIAGGAALKSIRAATHADARRAGDLPRGAGRARGYPRLPCEHAEPGGDRLTGRPRL